MVHGGGPTPVLNASLCATVLQARRYPAITAFYGARHGVAGILNKDLVSLSAQSDATLEAVSSTPGSAIGTSRYKMSDLDLDRILETFRGAGIRYFFCAGGNGSMDTALRIDSAARHAGYDLRVIGIPKTIDNDLAETDHSPGYPSAARFFAHAIRDIGADNRALPAPITVVEVIGRNAGWVAAATSLARHRPDDAPHLIYFPEQVLTRAKLLADVEAIYRRLGRAVVVVCEGQRDETGSFFGGAELNTDADARDKLPGNLAHVVARTIWSGLAVRARGEKPGLLGRSFALTVSTVDREEAARCGAAAVEAAVQGHSGMMCAIRRMQESPYRSEILLTPLDKVARIERLFPSEWIHESGHDVQPAFLEYATPLVGRIDPHAALEEIPV
jgi:ATP-dependent phosphofructokinase / diphosphate-dependent phosphofructokinase